MEILNLLLGIIFAVAIEVAGLFILFGVLLKDQPEMKLLINSIKSIFKK